MSAKTTFFSYSRTDSSFVLQLAKDLRDAGVPIWLDQLDIKVGSHWDSSIESALNDSGYLIIVLTPASVASNNVMDEVSYALENGKTIIPVLLKDCTVPFRLRRVQRIDFTGNYENGLKNLLEILERNVSENKTNNIIEPKPIVTEPVPQTLPPTQERIPAPIATSTRSKKEEKESIPVIERGNKKTSAKYILIAAAVVIAGLALWGIMQLNSSPTKETLASKEDSIKPVKQLPEDSIKTPDKPGAVEAKPGEKPGIPPGDKVPEKKPDVPPVSQAPPPALKDILASPPLNLELLPDLRKAENGKFLGPGQAIASPNKKYFLAYQKDGNLSIYNAGLNNVIAPVWQSFTNGNKSASQAILQTNGDFAIYNGTEPDPVIFTSQTFGHPNANLVLEDNGNLVIYDGNTKLWESSKNKMSVFTRPKPQDPTVPKVSSPVITSSAASKFKVSTRTSAPIKVNSSAIKQFKKTN